jgi:hypothetical protein
MRLQLPLSTTAFTLGLAFLTPARPHGADNAMGKVSENLYEISKPHMKDPFRWPSIWSLSPQSADPGGMEAWRASHNYNFESEPMPAEAGTAKPKSDWKASEERRTRAYMKKVGPLMPADLQAAPAADEAPKGANAGPVKHYLAQSILLTTPMLAESRSGGGYFPNECKLRYTGSNESEILQLFDEVVLSAGQESGVKTGDLYRTYQLGDDYRAYASGRALGRLVETRGIVEVVRVGAKSSVARLVKCYGTISRDSRASPLIPSPEVAATGYSPSTDNKLAAQVVWVTAQQQLPQPYSYAIVDRGSVKGYRLGDMVLFFNRNEGRMTDKVLGNGIVVSVADKSATILIRDLYPGIINRGDYTVVIQSTVL